MKMGRKAEGRGIGGEAMELRERKGREWERG